MLSILIPTYNYDCTNLVRDLHRQAECAGIDYEIVVADDASPIKECAERVREINTWPNCRLIELERNLGRARIRNRLADEARFEWLLFMDSDAEVISDSFIVDYLKHTDADVVCGGLCHADALPSPEVSLRYAYEKRADKKRAACYREQRPYEQFITFCFMVRASVFQAIRFDDSITEYGHEDTLFGVELERRKVNIRHIDNPMRQGGIETNAEFIEKTRAALRNLVLMEDNMRNHSLLLKLYGVLHLIRLDGCIARWFSHNEDWLKGQLLESTPQLRLFFLYKLGYYCSLKQE
jgi:glycosyltransferase involved in cell wall biosynthesis